MMSAEPGSIACLSCVAVTTRFYHHLDRRDYDRVVGLMAPDGVWARLGRDLVGRQAILEVLQARPSGTTTRHLLSNIVVDFHDHDSVEVFFDLSVYAQDGQGVARHLAIMSGADRLQCVDQAWSIQHKKVQPLFSFS